MSEAPTCPQCGTAIDGELINADVVVCTCGPMIYVRPMKEWFVRWIAVVAGANALAKQDPSLIAHIAALKKIAEDSDN